MSRGFFIPGAYNPAIRLDFFFTFGAVLPKIGIDDSFYLSPPSRADIPSFVQYLNEREIYERTLTIPTPYTLRDGEFFLGLCDQKSRGVGRPMNWAIRTARGELIGGIGWHGRYPFFPHREEVGYWIAKPLWNKGIMTRVLGRFCEYGFTQCGYSRIEAPIFEFNTASQRVAEKCGFVMEGRLRKAYCKDGDYFDGMLYARCTE
jgi:RimJ/RimL family protein N-acetyltransferase